MIMLYMIDLIEAWLPLFSSYLVYIFAFVLVISIIKIVRYFIYV